MMSISITDALKPQRSPSATPIIIWRKWLGIWDSKRSLIRRNDTMGVKTQGSPIKGQVKKKNTSPGKKKLPFLKREAGRP
jgi:hypothetical protein